MLAKQKLTLEECIMLCRGKEQATSQMATMRTINRKPKQIRQAVMPRTKCVFLKPNVLRKYRKGNSSIEAHSSAYLRPASFVDTSINEEWLIAQHTASVAENVEVGITLPQFVDQGWEGEDSPSAQLTMKMGGTATFEQMKTSMCSL